MKKSKILEIGKPKKWEGPHGDVFYIPLKLENGENISLGKKSESAFNVGDTVCYEVVEEGKKWKEVKENPFTPKGGFDPEKSNKSATIGMAMKIAFEHMYDKTNYVETIQLATRIFEDAMEIYENYGKKSEGEKLEDSTENDSLPF